MSAQRWFISACISAQSDQSLCCLYEESLGPCMRGFSKFCQRGPTLWFFFLLMMGEWIQIPLWAGHHQSASGHLNGVSLAGRWWPNIERWLGSFVIFQGYLTSIAKIPYMFAIFEGGPDPLSPAGSTHALSTHSVPGAHIKMYCLL